jgi:hypothetical protein
MLNEMFSVKFYNNTKVLINFNKDFKKCSNEIKELNFAKFESNSK